VSEQWLNRYDRPYSTLLADAFAESPVSLQWSLTTCCQQQTGSVA
jgi:hypothetical protein